MVGRVELLDTGVSFGQIIGVRSILSGGRV